MSAPTPMPLDLVGSVAASLSLQLPSAADNTGFRSFTIPTGGVSHNLLDLLTAAFNLDEGDVSSLLPSGFPAILGAITACRVSATGIVLEAQWSGSSFRPGLLEPFLPNPGTAVTIALAVNSTALDEDGSLLTVDLDLNHQPTLSANVDLESGAAGLAVTWPNGSPKLNTLLKQVDLDGIGFGDVSIEKIGVHAFPAESYFSIEIEINDLFSLPGRDFKIADAGLHLNYIRGDGGQLTGAATATAFLGRAPAAGQPDDRIQFDLEAAYDGPDLGWTFTGSAQSISIASVLGKLGVPSDSPFNDLHVDSVGLSFNTVAKDFTFTFAGNFPPVANAAMQAEIKLARQPDGSLAKSFSGKLKVGPVEFDLRFDRTGSSTAILGVFHDATAAGTGINVRDVVVAVAPPDVAAALPVSPTFLVKDALFAFQRGAPGGIGLQAQPGKFLFAIDTDFSLNLSGLANVPLIGQVVKDQALGASFEVLVHSENFDPTPLRSLLPPGAPHIPDQLPGQFQLLTTITFGDFTAQLDLGVEPSHLEPPPPPPGGQAPAVPATSAAVPATVAQPATDNVKWVDVQKHFGPLGVDRVGLSFDVAKKQIGVFLEAELSISGLTLSVEGLGGVYDLGTKNITFALRGLGIEFSRGGVEIAGGFLNQDGDFEGKVEIRAKSFTVSALGAVAVIAGEPSIFIYGLLNYPLGGPAFFYVEGLAAGFGYNRTFRMPTVDKVRECPLVQDALTERTALPRAAGDSDKAALTKQLQLLHEFVPPSVGEYFFAAGIKFSSFKLLNSFLLVGIVAGKHFEIDLLGVSTYQNPPVTIPNIPPLARIELNLIGRIAPEEGFAILQGQLTGNSFVYSNLVQLSGGFAFATWFAEPPAGNALGPHAGDFVLTIGGYHPKFNKPAWYPEVPRLGITYQITENIYVKGTAYFALTPSMLMAGAALEAHAEVGAISATFKASIDFLIGWEPYHYDASVSVSIKVHFGVDFEVGADVHVFGPPFSGVAHIHSSVISFTVEWGDANPDGPTPIPWSGDDGFRRKFLLSKTDDDGHKSIATLRLVAGIIGTDAAGVPNVNPGTLLLETSCPIPFSLGTLNGTTVAQLPADRFGIAPMNVASVRATHAVTVQKDDAAADASLVSAFRSSAVSKNFPPALWGKQFQVADAGAPSGLIDAFGGITIAIGPSLDDGTAVDALRRALDFSSPTQKTVAAVTSPITYALGTVASLGAPDSALLVALGFNPATAVSISGTMEDSLVAGPLLATV